MAITRYDPLTRFMTVRDALDRMFEDAFGSTRVSRPAGAILPIDMFERQDELVVMAAVPGVKPEEVEISVSNEMLTIKCTIHTESEKEESGNWTWYFHELDHGQFTRSISLPFPVAADKADAHFENGMLYLRLPKSAEALPKKIKVQAGAGATQQVGVGAQGGQTRGR